MDGLAGVPLDLIQEREYEMLANILHGWNRSARQDAVHPVLNWRDERRGQLCQNACRTCRAGEYAVDDVKHFQDCRHTLVAVCLQRTQFVDRVSQVLAELFRPDHGRQRLQGGRKSPERFTLQVMTPNCLLPCGPHYLRHKLRIEDLWM